LFFSLSNFEKGIFLERTFKNQNIMSLSLENACKEGYIADVKRIVHSGMDGPAEKLKAIRVAAARSAEVIRSKISNLREENIKLFMQFGNDNDLSKEQVVQMFIDAEDEVTKLPSADDLSQQLDETSRIALRQKPKVIREYIKKFTDLTEQLQKEDHASGNAEAVAVDERSDTVSIIVVDYQKPGNNGEPVLSAEARSSRQLLEHIVIAQDCQITELRNQFCALIATLTAHNEKQVQKMEILNNLNDEVLSEISDLKDEVCQLQEDLRNKPLFVSLKEHASAKECLRAGYDAGSLLRAGFSFKDLLDAGYNAKDLKLADVSFHNIAMNGFGCGPLLADKLITWADVESEWGVSKTSSQERLLEAGITFANLFECGYWSVSELKNVFSMEIIKAEFKTLGMKTNPKNPKDIKDVRLWIQTLKNRGWNNDIKEILELSNTTELKRLGFTLKDMRGIGFTAVDMCDSGTMNGKPFTSAEVGACFGLDAQRQSDLNTWTANWRTHPF
jgi:hypothetical protein